MNSSTNIVPVERIERMILLMRGQKVVVDSDLATLYGVPAKALIQAVRRNPKRFPSDFMFQLTEEEFGILRSHFVTSSSRGGWGGRRYPPYAFTEQGVAMLSTVLNSERAIEVNIAIMRAFVKLREILSNHAALAQKLAQLEAKVEGHDVRITAVFDAIRQLMESPDEKPPKRMGFHVKERTPRYGAKRRKG
jgi:phage regulator Rha-like protein